MLPFLFPLPFTINKKFIFAHHFSISMQQFLAKLPIYIPGFLAQSLFFTRSFIQWFSSEKAGKVLSPIIYWQISLVASLIMMGYGLLRKDPAIITGQFITFYVYIRNLQIEKAWKQIPVAFRYIVPFVPLVLLIILLLPGNYNMKQLTSNQNIDHWLMVFGIAAQVVFTFRFVYQWIVAERNQKSSLPLLFWFFSLTGGAMTFFYAFMRLDPVLLISNGLGVFMYSRNIIVYYTGRGLFSKRLTTK